MSDAFFAFIGELVALGLGTLFLYLACRDDIKKDNKEK